MKNHLLLGPIGETTDGIRILSFALPPKRELVLSKTTKTTHLKTQTEKETNNMITPADINLLRNKVSRQIKLIEPTLEVSDDDHTIAREIITEIPKILDDLQQGKLPTAEHIAKVAITACKDVQFRDFLLGAYNEYEENAIDTWLHIMSTVIKKEYIHPITTVLSTYYYRKDNRKKAKSMVTEVLKHNPDYTLAALLSRLYSNLLLGETLLDMTTELHPIVKANIFEQKQQ